MGFGVLFVNRLINEYSHGVKAQFIEGQVFKMVIPKPKGAIEGAVEGEIEGATKGEK